MKYNLEELGFILYNNRSVSGVVKNFIPNDIDPIKLIKIEEVLEYYKDIFHNQKEVEINIREFDTQSDDIKIFPKDIENLKQKVLDAHHNLSGIELDYLSQRNISQEIIDEYKLGGLSNIKEYQDLITLNATCHPVLKNIIVDGNEGGGIIIPLFKNQRLINCAIRKISDMGKLKYSLACPDLDVWGLDDIQDQVVYLTEGLFDMMALRSLGLKSVSVSSAMWSGIQLYKLLDRKPKYIVIFCDNDNVGLKTGFILHKFFNVIGIRNKTIISKYHKDPAEHIFENKLGMDDFEDINITLDMINLKQDNFNFINYLKNRKF
jgi:Toprim-like